MNRTLLLLMLVLAPAAHAGRHWISGQVVDRNQDPVDRAILKLSPGDVELVTDREGRFLIDYLRDDNGKRVRLSHRTDYNLEIFRPGFHVRTLQIEYRKGPLRLEPVVLAEESLRVDAPEVTLDPNAPLDTTTGAGATYEGQ